MNQRKVPRTRSEEGKATSRLEPGKSELKPKSAEEAGEQVQVYLLFRM